MFGRGSGAIGARFAAAPDQLAASRTRVMTSSSGWTAAILAFGSAAPRSRVKNVTAASVSSGALSAMAAPGAASAISIFCGLKGGMLADSSEVESDRLPATRTKLRTRTISRLLGPRLVWLCEMMRRMLLGSAGGGGRAAPLAVIQDPRPPPTPDGGQFHGSVRRGRPALTEQRHDAVALAVLSTDRARSVERTA